MWSNRKPDALRTAGPESKTLQANQPPKRFLATSQGTTQLNKEAARSTGAIAESVPARLGPGLHVKGEISGNEDLLIDGAVEGIVQLNERKLTVGTTGKVTADIIAREAVVCGNVKGNVRAKDRIEITKDGSVTGDLITAQIMIEDGAYFKGSIEIDRGVEEGVDKIVPSQAALS